MEFEIPQHLGVTKLGRLQVLLCRHITKIRLAHCQNNLCQGVSFIRNVNCRPSTGLSARLPLTAKAITTSRWWLTLLQYCNVQTFILWWWHLPPRQYNPSGRGRCLLRIGCTVTAKLLVISIYHGFVNLVKVTPMNPSCHLILRTVRGLIGHYISYDDRP